MNNDCEMRAPSQYTKPTLVRSSVTRCAELEYLKDMLPQMRKMAIGLQEPTLAYLLELAMTEAEHRHKDEVDEHLFAETA